MAGTLKKTGSMVYRQITILKKLMNPITGTVEHSHVRVALKKLEERWNVYEPMYEDAEVDDADPDATEVEFARRQDRYLSVLYPACQLLDSATPEAESVRERSN